MANFLRVYELFVKHKNDEDFKKIQAKTLVMTGENDIGSTIEMSQQLNNVIKGSELKIIKDGKHLCGIECADEVNLSIKNLFVGQHKPQNPRCIANLAMKMVSPVLLSKGMLSNYCQMCPRFCSQGRA